MSWQPIDSAPRDGTQIMLMHPAWDVAYKAWWDWVEGPDENGKGGFCLWHLADETGGAMGDALLWPEEDVMPTLWTPAPPEMPYE